MKKILNGIFSLIVVAVCAFCLTSCAKTYTVTFKNGGDTVVGTVSVKHNKTVETKIDGYVLVGNLYTSLEGFTGSDTEKVFDKSTKIKADTTLYGQWAAVNTGNTYTYYTSFSLSPETFNPLQYKSTTDSIPLDYTTNSLYGFAYNADGTGFELVPVMAAADPVDVTANYAADYDYMWEDDTETTVAQYLAKSDKTGFKLVAIEDNTKWVEITATEKADLVTAGLDEEEYIYEESYEGLIQQGLTAEQLAGYGIEEGYLQYYLCAKILKPTTGYVFRIALNEDAKWENGEPITADDYMYSLKAMLDPKANNYRASNYYQSQPAIYGAKDYFYSGKQGWVKSSAAYTEYTTALDENLVFTMGEGLKDFGNLSTDYHDWVIDWASSYFETDKSAARIWRLLTQQPYGDFTSLYDADTQNGYEVVPPLLTQLEGKTIAEIKADTTLATYYAVVEAVATVYGFDPLGYTVTYAEFPTYNFEHVGLKKVNEYTVDIIYTGKQLVGFYQKYTISLPLVNETLYEACKTADPVTGAVSSTYGTSASTYMGYGPYKLTRYVTDLVMEFEKNPNWFGYMDKYSSRYGEFTRGVDQVTCKQYQTTNIVFNYVPNISTREMMFNSGLLDTLGLNKALYTTYKASSRLYNAEGAATFYGIILSDYEDLVEREAVLNGTTYTDAATYAAVTKTYNKTILSIKEFRQALCYALDRKTLLSNLYPGGTVATSLFSNLIVADPENGKNFNDFESTKEAICAFWGVEYGAGKTFATLDEAYKSINGYDLTTAKALVETAVAKAIQAGYMDANSIVKLEYCSSSDSETDKLWYETFKSCLETLVKGTSLEGKFEYVYDTSLGSDFGGSIQSGKADTSWGFGWSGGELDPYDLFQVYVDAAAGEDEPYQYDMWLDRSDDAYNITYTYNTVAYTYSVYEWWQILNGSDDAPDGMNWQYGKIADSVRAEILGMMEQKVLEDYTTIPLFNEGSIQLLSYKLNYGKETYNFAMGFGGIRYMTYNMTDSEWSAYVQSLGGTLNYKG